MVTHIEPADLAEAEYDDMHLLASPALADENHSDHAWGCKETAIAVTAARSLVKGGGDV